MIVNMIWHVPQKVVKCYFIPLPRLSYIYWLIHFNVQLKPIIIPHKSKLMKLLSLREKALSKLCKAFIRVDLLELEMVDWFVWTGWILFLEGLPFKPNTF